MAVSILKKITVAQLGFDSARLSRLVKDTDKPVALARVFGRIAGAEAKASDVGPYSLFNGEFAAVLADGDGTEYRSGRMILPQIAEAVIAPLVAEAGVGKKSGTSVQFAVDLSAERNLSKRGGLPYKFGVTLLGEPAPDDFLTKLRKELETKKPLALPKPPKK